MGKKDDVVSTLFIGNLSKETSISDLTDCFSQFGPVKRCVVVVDKATKESKGYGFVVFSLPSDALLALEEHKKKAVEIRGRPVRLDADNNATQQVSHPKTTTTITKEQEPVKPTTTGSVSAAQNKKPIALETKRAAQNKKPVALETKRTSKEVDERRVALFNLVPEFTDKQLMIRLKKRGGKVVGVERVSGDRAIVTYETVDEARDAVRALDGREWSKKKVKARRLPQTFAKHLRMIVRNVGFHVDDKVLCTKLEEFGPLDECFVARNEAKESRGFGFVQFTCKADAEAAMKALNGIESDLGPKGKGVIALDYALPKDKYDRVQRDDAKRKEQSSKQLQDEKEEAEKVQEEEEKDPKEEEENDETTPEEPKSNSTNKEEKEEEEKRNAVEEGRTLFVSNLLFETTEASIRARFSEFGAVRGVKIVRDARTQLPRGTAFVEFWRTKGADRALEQNPLLLEGRAVYALRALAKNAAPKSAAAAARALRDERKRDKRRLFLIDETFVKSDDCGPDAVKREREANDTKEKKRSPMFFLSPTRLVIRNLNRKPEESVDSKKLQRVVLEAVYRGLREGVVTSEDEEASPDLFPSSEWRNARPRTIKTTVMREDVDNPASRSSGFGFVEFEHHAHALAAARVLNNNPEFSHIAAGGAASMKLPPEKRSRLIVSFSVENLRKVQLKGARQERSKRVRDSNNSSSSTSMEKTFSSSTRKKKTFSSSTRKGKTFDDDDKNNDDLVVVKKSRRRLTTTPNDDDADKAISTRMMKKKKRDSEEENNALAKARTSTMPLFTTAAVESVKKRRKWYEDDE